MSECFGRDGRRVRDEQEVGKSCVEEDYGAFVKYFVVFIKIILNQITL